MDWSNIESGWKAYRLNARQQWSRLSEDQVDATMGKREALSIRLQEAYDVSEEEAERQIADWQAQQAEKRGPAQ